MVVDVLELVDVLEPMDVLDAFDAAPGSMDVVAGSTGAVIVVGGTDTGATVTAEPSVGVISGFAVVVEVGLSA